MYKLFQPYIQWSLIHQIAVQSVDHIDMGTFAFKNVIFGIQENPYDCFPRGDNNNNVCVIIYVVKKVASF